MAISTKDLQRYCTSKLQLGRSEGTKHDAYRLCLGSGQIPLPIVVRIPRHAGDVSMTVLKGTANDLGLKTSELECSERCEISREGILVAISCRLLAVVFERHKWRADDASEDVDAAIESIELLLGDCRLSNIGRKKAEGKLYRRLSIVLQSVRSDKRFAGIADRLEQQMRG